MKRLLLAIMTGLLVACAYTLWQTDLWDQTRYRLAVAGLVRSGSNEGFSGRRETLDSFAADDAAVKPGSVMLIGDSIVRSAPYRGDCLVNRGIGGERSDQLLANMRRWPSLDRAGAVIISIGINDVFQLRDEGLGARIAEILGQIDAPTYLLAMKAELPGIDRGNRVLKNACTGRCQFVDYPAVLIDDRIHLAAESYVALARRLPLNCPPRPAGH